MSAPGTPARAFDPTRLPVTGIDWTLDRAIDIVVWVLPALILGPVGFFVGNGIGLPPISAGIITASVWYALYVLVGIRLVEQQGYYIIETLSQYRTVWFGTRGWPHFLRVPFDTIKRKGTLKAQDISPYSAEKLGESEKVANINPKIDFRDVSAPVGATFWFFDADPKHILDDNWKMITNAVVARTYVFAHALPRALKLIDGSLRPRLEALTLDEANVSKTDVCTKTIDAIREQLRQIGVYPSDDTQALILGDIELPPEVEAIRQKALEGESVGKAISGEMQGTLNALAAIEKQGGEGMTDKEARAFYLSTRSINAAERAEKLTLVARDMGQVNTMLTIDEGGTK